MNELLNTQVPFLLTPFKLNNAYLLVDASIETDTKASNPLTVALAKVNPVMFVGVPILFAAVNTRSFDISPRDGVTSTLLIIALPDVNELKIVGPDTFKEADVIPPLKLASPVDLKLPKVALEKIESLLTKRDPTVAALIRDVPIVDAPKTVEPETFKVPAVTPDKTLVPVTFTDEIVVPDNTDVPVTNNELIVVFVPIMLARVLVPPTVKLPRVLPPETTTEVAETPAKVLCPLAVTVVNKVFPVTFKVPIVPVVSIAEFAVKVFKALAPFTKIEPKVLLPETTTDVAETPDKVLCPVILIVPAVTPAKCEVPVTNKELIVVF